MHESFKTLAAAHNDTFAFDVKITAFGEPTSAVRPRTADETAAVTAAGALDGGDGKNTDVVFRMGGEDISAHRSVLAARSSVLEAMFAQHWSEGAASSSSSSSSSSAMALDDSGTTDCDQAGLTADCVVGGL